MNHYNLPETVYILFRKGTEYIQKMGGRNKTTIQDVADVKFDSDTVAVPHELKFISDTLSAHEVDDSKRVYLLYDRKNGKPYFDIRNGKTLVCFSNYTKASKHMARLNKSNNDIIILTCSCRAQTRKWHIDKILEEL